MDPKTTTNAAPSLHPHNRQGRLQGKVAIVTGAAQGMGRAIAERFAEEGATVVATDVREGAPYTSTHVSFAALDVSRPEGWQALMADVLARHHRIDVLVNNAGIMDYAPVDTITPEAWQRMIDVDQTGVLLGMQAVLPAMRTAKSGSIVNTSSIWGLVAIPGAVAYHAVKGAVLMMTKNAAVTYAPDNIRVNSVHPGIIGTPMVLAQDAATNSDIIGKTPLGRLGEPREIANGVLFLASDEASFMTGAELVIDGGYTAQ